MASIIALLCYFFSLFFLFNHQAVQAASLYLSPGSGTHNVGATFTLNLIVNSADQAMNAASGIVSFPADKLEVVSLTKGGSIFSLWVQEPSFNNSSGRVNFEGIVLNPGFTGASGRLLSITFKAKAAGSAIVNFSSGLVLANDGQGTNITSGLGKANLTIKTPEPTSPGPTPSQPVVPTPAPTPPVDSRTSKIANFISINHPDSSQWYNQSTARFSWGLSDDVTAVRLLLSPDLSDKPSVLYRPAITERQIDNLEDGIWYFSIQAQNQFGWGQIEQFRLQIDTLKPDSLSVTEVERLDSSSPEVTFIIKSNDTGSGISHYEIQLNDQPVIIWQDDGSNLFTAPDLSSGRHQLIVKAIDRAGNFLVDVVDFVIADLNPPVINDWSTEVVSGDYLIIRGETEYPGAQITLFWQVESGEVQSRLYHSNQEGKFVIVNQELTKSGKYRLWLTVENERGLVSLPSEAINVIVQKESFINISSRAVNSLKFFIPLLILIIVSSVLVIYAWYRIFILRKKLNEKIEQTDLAINSILSALNGNIKKKLSILEEIRRKKVSSPQEKNILNQVARDLKTAEKKISQEIGNIKKIKR